MTKEQKILLLFVLAIVGAGGVYYVTQSSSTTKEPANVVSTETTSGNTQTNTVPTGTGSVPVATTETATSKTIEEKLSYQVPEDHTEEITVTAIIDSTGTIVDVKFAYAPATNRESKEYLAKFTSSFKSSLVVGQKISTAKASRVGGASLTTAAFNKALANIAAKA